MGDTDAWVEAALEQVQLELILVFAQHPLCLQGTNAPEPLEPGQPPVLD